MNLPARPRSSGMRASLRCAACVIVAAFAALPGVATCAWSDEARALHIRLTENADAQDAMQRMLQATPLRRVELRRTTLDEVFVRLVGGDESVLAAQEAAGD